MKNEHENPETPETVSPAGVSLYHPLTQATTSIQAAIDPAAEYAELEALAAELIAAAEYEHIRELGDPSLMLALQARVLDTVFNRFIARGFLPSKAPNLDYIRMALMAQRQCTIAIDKLNRRRKLQNIDERTEEGRK